MNNMNKAILSGHLGSDPERNSPKSVTFSLAVNERWTDAEKKKQERTNWFRVVCFNGTADNATKYLKKGSHILIEGTLRENVWDDDGTKKSRVEVVATSIIFLDRKPSE